MRNPAEGNDPPPESGPLSLKSGSAGQQKYYPNNPLALYEVGTMLGMEFVMRGPEASMKTSGTSPSGPMRTLPLPEEPEQKSSDFYTIAADGGSITCHVCGFTSPDPEHVRQRFCPRCVIFHEDHILMLRLAEGYQRALAEPSACFARQ
jgi:hypothetical protein